ncbi:MAG: hypothetical protein D6722_10770 [Bacteroidetes bacterium]|nr:MAG: hypothetical protein D6722_10770 [Bacteroidota bacterium]
MGVCEVLAQDRIGSLPSIPINPHPEAGPHRLMLLAMRALVVAIESGPLRLIMVRFPMQNGLGRIGPQAGASS